MSDIAAVAAAIYTDEVASEKVGHPVVCNVMSRLSGDPLGGDPLGRDALVIFPRDPDERRKGEVYSYHQFNAESTPADLAEAFEAVCSEWQKTALPNLVGEGR
jgi:hypothetical protein